MSCRWRLTPDSRSLPADGHQSLLRLQQDAQAGARDVFEAAAVERDRALDLVEEGLGGRGLRGVQPPGDDDDAVRRQNQS